jgi:hypothetical protein
MLRFMLHGKDNTPFLIANIWLEKSSCKMTITLYRPEKSLQIYQSISQ